MSLTLRDFAAVAGSTNSIGYVTMNDKGGLEKAGNHLHLTSLNVVPSGRGSTAVRDALYSAISSAMGDKIDTDRGQSFLNSVARQLGLGENSSGLAATPLDRRTVRALVKATEAEFGAGGKTEKATAEGQALAAFLGGKTDGAKLSSRLLVGLMEGVNTLLTEDVDDVWVAGEKPGESFYLQKTSGNDVTVDCGGGKKFTISRASLAEKSQLSLAGRKDLADRQLLDILDDVERNFKGVKDFKALSGNSAPGIRFARALSEKALLARLGDEGLTANELRNVPPRMMHYLARNVAEGGMTLEDLRDYVAIACADRFNAETTLEILDMYEKADNKDSVGYAEERKAAEAAKAEAAKKAEEPKKFSLFGAIKAGIGAIGQKVSEVQNAKAAVQALLADVVSDKRSFLADQHPEPGGRLQVTLQTHTKALATLLCNYALVENSLPDEAEGFVKPLVAAMKDLLGPDVKPSLFNMSEVQSLLEKRLAGDDVKARLATVEREVDKTAAELCTRMQYKLNHSFVKLFGSSAGGKAVNDRYDELIEILFDDERFASAPLAERDALLGKIDGFVESFAKVGWSEKALGHVLDEALGKDALDIKDATQKVDKVIARYAKFSELAKLQSQDIRADDIRKFEQLEGLVNFMKASPDEKTAFLNKLVEHAGRFASVGGFGTCCTNFLLRCNSCVEDFGKACKGADAIIETTKPLADFAAKVASDGGDLKKEIQTTITKMMNGIATRKDLSISKDVLNANLPRLGEALSKLKDAQAVPGALNNVLKVMDFGNDEKKAIELDASMQAISKDLNDPAKLRSPDSDAKSTGIQNLADFLKANGMNADGLQPEVTKPDYELRELRREKSRKLLTKLGGSNDMDKGYGLFMTKVMKEYVKSMSLVDQRAMLAAGIRFAEAGGSEMKQMGAFLKGAGPIMQKMLQGLASMDMDKDFLEALADMKSNLPDIADDVVKANLLDMVNRSEGKVKDIELTKKLGAASVGQAFLCTVTMSDGTKQDVVVKMLRPEAEQRAEREKNLFIKVSKEVPGMEKTFDGQLEGILDELDFRKEAENTKSGAVYDKGGMGVKSTKLLDVIAPTKYTMVQEKAPGIPVDRLIVNTEKKIETLTDAFFKQVPKKDDNGKEITGADGKPVMERVLNVDAFKKDGVRDMAGLSNAFGKAVVELSRLYEETLVQQKRVVALAEKWTLEGIYQKGFYHGDLHAGNIMVDDRFERDANGKLLTDRNGGLTVIDFGNATTLTSAQQKNVIKMMTAANTKDSNVFLENFCALMSPEGQARFMAERKANHDLIHNIFNLGSEDDSTDRIFAVLQQLQLKGYELPGPIFKFSQCAIRLQGTISQLNGLLDKIKKATLQFREGMTLGFGADDKELQAMDQHAKLLVGIFKGGDLELGDDACDFTVLQKKIDEKLAAVGQEQPKQNPKVGVTSEARPKDVLMKYFSDKNRAVKANEVCEKLVASLAGLKETNRPVYDALEKAKSEVVEASKDKNPQLAREIEDLKSKLQPGNAYDLYLYEKKMFTEYENAGAYLNGPDGTKFLERMIKRYEKHGKSGQLAVGEEIARLSGDVPSNAPRGYAEFMQHLANSLATQIASAIEGRKDGTLKESVLDAVRNELLQGVREFCQGSEVSVRQAESRPEIKEIIEKTEKLVADRTGLQKALENFGVAYENAQKALLEDLKNQLAPICHKNKKGEIDARLVPTEDLKTFGEAVGHVIANNLTSSVMKTGLGLSIEAGWKSLTRPKQTPTV